MGYRWPLELLRGSQAPRRAVCGTRGSVRTMHRGGSAPSCCAFTHRVAFEEGSWVWTTPEEGIGHPLYYSWASPVAQTVKNPPEMWKTWVTEQLN